MATRCKPWNSAIDPLGGAPVAVLMGAAMLAAERHNGLRLQDLTEQQRRDLYIDAEAQLAWYKERHS